MKKHVASFRRTIGFSIIELMTVVVIIAILVASASTSLMPVLEKREVNSTANALYIALQDTSFIATQRSTTATLCPIDDRNCAVNSWSSDYGIFALDSRTPGTVKLVRRFNAPTRGVRIITDTNDFSFSKDGFLNSAAPLNIQVCHPKYDDYWIELTLDLSGIVTQTDNFYTGNRPRV